MYFFFIYLTAYLLILKLENFIIVLKIKQGFEYIATKDYKGFYSKNLNLKKYEKYILLDNTDQNWFLIK